MKNFVVCNSIIFLLKRKKEKRKKKGIERTAIDQNNSLIKQLGKQIMISLAFTFLSNVQYWEIFPIIHNF